MRITVLLFPLLLVSCDGFGLFGGSDDTGIPEQGGPNYPHDHISFVINNNELSGHVEANFMPHRCRAVHITFENVDQETQYVESFGMTILFDEDRDSYTLKRELIDDFEDDRIVHPDYCDTHFHLGSEFHESDWNETVATYYPPGEETDDINKLFITDFDPSAGEYGRLEGEFETTLHFDSGEDTGRRYPDTLHIRNGKLNVHLKSPPR